MTADPDEFPSPEQEVLLNRAGLGESLVIVAGPGTGKSRTALAMALQKIRVLADEPRAQVLFLSFSNAAVRRLAASAGVQFSREDRRRLRFMTFHSCAAEFLALYGRFVGLSAPARVIDRLEERLRAIEADWDEHSPEYSRHLQALAKQEGLLAFSMLLPLGTSLLTLRAKHSENSTHDTIR
jgi:DNA helicase-2/ATP-dependent DNA helicase PcrA